MGFATATIALIIGIGALVAAAAAEGFVAYKASKLKNGTPATIYASVMTGLMVVYAIIMLALASFMPLPFVWIWFVIIGMVISAGAICYGTFAKSQLWGNTQDKSGSCDCVAIMTNTSIIAFLVGLAIALTFITIL